MLIIQKKIEQGRGWCEKTATIVVRPKEFYNPLYLILLLRKKHHLVYKFRDKIGSKKIITNSKTEFIDEPVIDGNLIIDSIVQIETKYPFFINCKSMVASDIDERPSRYAWSFHSVVLDINMLTKEDVLFAKLSLPTFLESQIFRE